MSLKYTDLVPPPCLAVRRETACAMIQNASLFDRLVKRGLLSPVDPSDPVPLFDVEEIRQAWAAYRGGRAKA